MSAYRSHYISQLSAGMEGEEVILAGWVHEVRDLGKLVFLLLRDHTGIIQITGKDGIVEEAIKKSLVLPKESVIMVKGRIAKSAMASKGFEIIPLKVTNLNPITAKIPFEVTGKVPADIDVRLDYRYIDFRRLETTSIFNIEASVLDGFRNAVIREGFQELRPTNLVEAATEGGADLFQVAYFEKKAYLAQSPQLYKQLAVLGGMDRVFMIASAFRAEKHNTIFHLNESTQMDIEMGFADQNDAIRLLKKTVSSILKNVAGKNGADLATLKAELKESKVKIVTYKQALDKLAANDAKIQFGDDFNREYESMLGSIYGDMLIIKDYPTSLRAFYSMPKPEDPELCNSYDFIYKGIEISSGAQRIHDPDALTESIKSRGLNPNDFKFYIDAFRCGAPPHAGWSIGLERFTMKITGSSNIRECSPFPRDRNRLTP